MSQLLHQPHRPDWVCEDCDRDWPCDPARKRLMAETGGGTGLAMLMVAELVTFCGERPTAPAGEAFERFVAWTRRAPLPVAGPRPR